MKAIIPSAIMACLLIGAQSVYAETEYQPGFKRGVSDGRTPQDQNLTPVLKASGNH
jgi:hypothetical protein